MNYPINYEFGKNWDTKIKPFLDNPKIKKAIRKGVNDYLSIFPINKRYKNNSCPAIYSSNDSYAIIIDRKEEILMEKLRKNNLLPKQFTDLELKLQNMTTDEDIDNIAFELLEMKMEIVKPYFTWDKIKYDLDSYILSGSCFWQ